MRVVESNKGMSIRGMLVAAIFLFMIAVIYPFAEHLITTLHTHFGDAGLGIVTKYINSFQTVLGGFLLIVFLMLIISAQARGGVQAV